MITSLLDSEDLKSLRLTNREICAAATKSLFRSVVLLDTAESYNAVESIMTHPHLKGLIRKIYFLTVEFDFVSHISFCSKITEAHNVPPKVIHWLIGL